MFSQDSNYTNEYEILINSPKCKIVQFSRDRVGFIHKCKPKNLKSNVVTFNFNKSKIFFNITE